MCEEVLSSGLISNCLGLAVTEFSKFDEYEAYDWRALAADGNARLLYVDDDEWAPLPLMERARAAGVKAEHLAGARHAFCTVPSPRAQSALALAFSRHLISRANSFSRRILCKIAGAKRDASRRRVVRRSVGGTVNICVL